MRKVRKLISNKGEKINVFRRNKNKLKKKGGGGRSVLPNTHQ
jgi:hypothetical protein